MKQKLNELDHKTEKKEQKNSTTTTSTAFERIQFWRCSNESLIVYTVVRPNFPIVLSIYREISPDDREITIHLQTNKKKNQIGNFLTYRIKPPAPPSYY